MNKPVLNPQEAPQGYFAVLKSSVKSDALGNICRACDWRPTCQKQDTDFTSHNHRCMDYGVIHRVTGQEVRRIDGCSVVFKLLPPAQADRS